MLNSPWTLLNYAFRPFFLFGGLFAIVVIALWIMTLHGIQLLSPGHNLTYWHAHEMLVGFATGAVAGFVLTAVATWTGRTPVQGPWLGVLVIGWLAGRLAMCLTGRIPDVVVTVLDMAFPILLTGLATREIVGGASKRNYHIAGILGLLAAANLGYHIFSTGIFSTGSGARVAVYLIMHLLLLLMTIIAGRIIPSFTANWLRARGATKLPTIYPRLDTLVLALTLVAGVTDSFWSGTAIAGVFALAAAILHTVRFARWRTMATFSDPLLAILHFAYCWILLGYLLLALSAFGLGVPRVVALHALGMGGLGGMILAVATRVGLAHTGRPLRVRRLIVVAYGVFGLAVITRLAGPLFPSVYSVMLDLSAGLWIVTFSLFLWVYAPMVVRPRVDGRPERPVPVVRGNR